MADYQPSLKRPAEMMEQEEISKRRRLPVIYKRHPKPPYTYLSMIAVAIHRSKNQRLTLWAIHDALEGMFDFFKGDYRGWRDSVRHNLSNRDCFVSSPGNRENGNRYYWTVDLSLIPTRSFMRTTTKNTDRWAPDIFQQLGIPDFSLSHVKGTKKKKQPKAKEGQRPSFSIDNILDLDKPVQTGEPVDTKYDHPYSFLSYHSLPPVQFGDLVFAPDSSEQQSSFCPPGRYDDIDSMSLKDYYMQRDVQPTDLTTSTRQRFRNNQDTTSQQMYYSQEASHTPQTLTKFFSPFQTERSSYASNIAAQKTPHLPVLSDVLTTNDPPHQPCPSDFIIPQLYYQDRSTPFRQLSCESYVSNSICRDDNFHNVRTTAYHHGAQTYRGEHTGYHSKDTDLEFIPGSNLLSNASNLTSNTMYSDASNLTSNTMYNDASNLTSNTMYNDASNLTSNTMYSDASNITSNTMCIDASNQDNYCSTPGSLITEFDDIELFSNTSSPLSAE